MAKGKHKKHKNLNSENKKNITSTIEDAKERLEEIAEPDEKATGQDEDDVTEEKDAQIEKTISEKKESKEKEEHQPDFSQMERNKKKGFKGFLHKFFRIILILFAIILVVNVVIVLVAYINHKNKLADERGYLFPTGQMVNVNGHDLHVIVDGNQDADTTLVFIHSTGIVDDSVALQPLFGYLQDYRIVYIDRSGFGYSENAGAAKDIDSIVEEMRATLKAVGIEGSYVLVPNGIAGLEATYWAKKYSSEVDGIVGITISIAEEFDGITEEQYCGVFNYVMTLFAKVGGHRFVKSIYPENIGAIYTEKQMLVRKALISKGFYTTDMYQEDLETIANAAKVKALGWPEDTPMLLLIANPLMEPYINDDASVREEYDGALKSVYGTQTDADGNNPDGIDYVMEFNTEKKAYYEKYKNVNVVEISGPSRLYTYNPKAVADAIISFTQDIDK